MSQKSSPAKVSNWTEDEHAWELQQTLPRVLLPGAVSLRRTGYFSTRDSPPPRSVMMSSMLMSDSLSDDPVSLHDSSSLLVLHSSSASARPATQYKIVRHSDQRYKLSTIWQGA